MFTQNFQQDIDGYSGTLDTHIRESRPDRVFADALEVHIDGSDSALQEIQGLLQFSDIFGGMAGQIPLGATITSATLTFNVTDGSRDGVSLYRMARDWVAQPIWSWNAFDSGIQTDGIEALAEADVTVSAVSRGAEAFDVTDSLQAWSNGAENYGWLLRTHGPDGWAFTSSESGTAPILSVTYEMPVDPIPGLVVFESDGQTIVTEGGADDTIAISLATAPTHNVTVSVSTTATSDATLTPTLLTFTPQNWNTPQEVLISAIDDNKVEGTEQFTITLTAASSDPDYQGVSHTVALVIIDNDLAPPPLNPTLVAVHDTTQYWPGDPSGAGAADPSGIAYVPGLDLLFIVDSEHNESPFFSPINLFTVRLDGTFVQSYSMNAFTFEPTGIAYNPHNGLLYITDDDANRIFIVDPMDPTKLVDQIDLRPLGIRDAEDPVIDPVTGNIYLLDGSQRTLFELTATGQFVGSKVLPSVITDAEALAFDPAADAFYFASGLTRGTIFQTDRDGNILAEIDLLNDYRHPDTGFKPKIKGLELAPSSNPDDGDKMSLYAVDYGVDQFADGRLFEIDLYHDNWHFV